ncbi:MAG: hypothetical protein WAW23_07795, partial [Candidatus Methanoperedens sp.]
TQKTTQRVLKNIRVNILHANCIQITRKNQHLQMIVRGNREAEPQISVLLTLSVNLSDIALGLRPQTPTYAPPLAGFIMKSPVA